jgi:hypothetical protein
MDGKEIYLQRLEKPQKTTDPPINRFVYPTAIILPLIIALVVVIASTANFISKLMAIILLLISLFFYVIQLRNVNIVQICRQKYQQMMSGRNKVQEQPVNVLPPA